MASITLQGNPCNTIGDLPAVGATAPDFRLVDKDLGDVSLSSYAGKKKLINIVPSLDTPVCAKSTLRFNKSAGQHTDTVVLVISADLPFAMGRFCTAEGVENVVSLSMMRGREFGKNYGVLITDGPLEGLLARAIVVLDSNNKVLHTELVGEIANEPNYEAAVAAL